MLIDTSMQPLAPSAFGPGQARHLLLRAGFGGDREKIADLTKMGSTAAVDSLLDYQQISTLHLHQPDVDRDVILPLTHEQRRTLHKARRKGDQETLDKFNRVRLERRRNDRKMHHRLQDWWLERMIHTPRPLEEKLTLLWHGHFASRYRNVRDAFLMYQQNELFRDNAAGNFTKLAVGVVRDPAMLKFLNNDRNIRTRPNENLAREFMELFTLGEGNYTEQDIKQGARALSGYHVDDNDFLFRFRAHDRGSKLILGQRGKFDGDMFVHILLARKACARFIAYKLYRHFVGDIGDEPEQWTPAQSSVISKLGDLLFSNDYELRPALRTLLNSRHFYDASVVGQKIKSPIELLVGLVRCLHTPMREPKYLRTALNMMGQTLFDPPSVAGWDGGRGWINTSTLFVRQNLCVYMITGMLPKHGKWRRDAIGYDPMKLIAHMHEPAPKAVVDHLVDSLLGAHVPLQRREPLISFVRQRSQGVTADSMIGLLLLITAMPEYQLC